MKYLKRYNEINEGLRDMMKSKDENQILKDLRKLDIVKWLDKVKEYDLGEEFMPSDEEIKSYLKEKSVLLQLNLIERYNLDDKFKPSIEVIMNDLNNVSPYKKLDFGIDFNIYELVEKSINEGGDKYISEVNIMVAEKNIDIFNLLIKNSDKIYGVLHKIKIKEAKDDIFDFLKNIGFDYKNYEYSEKIKKLLNYNLISSDSIRIPDFNQKFKKYISEKKHISVNEITNNMYLSNFNDIILPKILDILDRYNIKFDEKNTNILNTLKYDFLDIKVKYDYISNNDIKIVNLLRKGVSDIEEFYKIIKENL